ncbi:MAG: hypothetical protein ACE5HS_22100, partial [bacterium]
YLRPFPGPGAPIRVSGEGGSRPRWRQNGQELFYLNGKKQIVAVEVEFASKRPRISPPTIVMADPEFRLLDVHPDGQRFLLQPEEETRSGSQLTILRDWQGLLEEPE